MNKIWCTAQEIADMKLPGLPTTKQGVLLRAKRYKWPSRPHGDKQNGGREYLLLLAMMEARLDEITPELRRCLLQRLDQLEQQHKEAGSILKSLRRFFKSQGVFLAEKR